MGNPDSAALHNQEPKKRGPVAYPRLHEALFVRMMAIEKTGKHYWYHTGGRGILVWRLDGEGLFLGIFIL